MGKDRWRVDDGFVLRTPLLPTRVLTEWSTTDPRGYLASLLSLPEIDEAIFVASPSLHGALDTWRANPTAAATERVQHALVKYVARMAARSTPFGLFSGVATGTVGRETVLELGPRAEYQRRTRLDNDYLFVLADDLSRAHRDRLVVRPNSSLYRIGDQLRCAIARVEDRVRQYELISIQPTPYLDATLLRAANGATVASLAEPLVDAEISLDEAHAYIVSLVEAQVLVPELGVQVTGAEPIDAMIAQLRTASLDVPAHTLASARAAIAQLDAKGLGNRPDSYRAIASELETLPPKVDLARLFQVDLVKPAALTLGRKVTNDVLDAVTQLARISPLEQPSLDAFRQAFAARYEDREVPLAEALDEESGIGFEVSNLPGSEGAPLLVGLGFPAGTTAAPSWRHRHLLERLASAGDELVIDDKDFAAMAVDRPSPLPEAFATMIRVGPTHSYLYAISGPSGAQLHGRFCHLSPNIDAMVRAHHAREEALAPDATFAEIVHLNDGRVGNVLCRPVLRSHEIVFLGRSGAASEQQLSIDDLTVSVRAGRIVLRSRRLGREVLPRLTTAHNYRNRSLGVYRFLCAVAHQGVGRIGWSWGPLADAPHLPRVRYGNVVLSRALWNLTAAELAPIKTGGVAVITALRERRSLPRFIALADGDNELPVDLENPLLLAALADELAGRTRAQLVELFPAPDDCVVQGPEGRFASEAILMFTRQGEPRRSKAPIPAPRLRRQFVPGSEWLYAKIYGGASTADRVLRDAIAPLVRAHDGPWFFLRYGDPDPHIRVRFHGDPRRLLGETLPALERSLAPLLATGVARKLTLDTYERELERYGGDAGMELVEQVFWRDSEAVLGIVELLDGDAGADARWRLAVRGIESMLAALGLTPAEREKVVTDGCDSLGREMRADTALWSRIGDRFAAQRVSLDQLFVPDAARDAEHDLAPGFELLAQRDEHLVALGHELRSRDVPVTELAWSLVHMHANRILHASQRAQELVLYNFLRRLHASRRSRRT